MRAAGRKKARARHTEDVGEDEQALRVLFPDHLRKGKYTLIQMNAFCLFFFQKEIITLQIMKLTQKLTRGPDAEFRWSLESC